MISKNKIKLLRSLKLKKNREQNQKTILEGIRLIDESINAGANIESIFMLEEIFNSNKNLVNKIKNNNIPLNIITKEDLKEISDTEHSQGIVAEVKINYSTINHLSSDANKIIILDNISDPGNLGTIFRTCAWYGIKSIILSSGTVDPFNFKSMRASMGAHFYFDNIIIDNSQSIINFLDSKYFNVYCADLNGLDITEINPNKNWAVILGSEAHGISKSFEIYDKLTIKQHGKIESLNVSVACGIILNQLVK
tara:strand:+ start:4196 stop:4951 length:756 start_codon:yes stop_codon:yes gene_type:complete